MQDGEGSRAAPGGESHSAEQNALHKAGEGGSYLHSLIYVSEAPWLNLINFNSKTGALGNCI